MLVSKATLQRTLKALQRFDPAGSPFIGLQWGTDQPLFHRASADGIIESIGYRRDQDTLIVSLSHLAATLANTAAEHVDLSADRAGILSVVGSTEMGTDDMRVYTVRPTTTWAKRHDVGDLALEFDKGIFAGINTTPFTLAAPPVLRRKKLMLATNHGIVMRDIEVDAFPYPREAFLRSVSVLPVETLFTTRGGYWGALAGGMKVLVAGHRAGDATFDLYSVGATTVIELPSERLLTALKTASDMAADKSLITLDQANGVQVRDEYGYLNKFTFGGGDAWPAFSIRPRTARVIYDAMTQVKDETIELQRMDAETMRLKRGPWEVSFKFFAPGASGN